MQPSSSPRCGLTAPLLSACSIRIASIAQVDEQQASFHLKLHCSRGWSVGACIWFWYTPPLLSVPCALELLQKHCNEQVAFIS